MITIHVIALLLALICFILAAIEVSAPRVNLVALGLALWIVDVLVR